MMNWIKDAVTNIVGWVGDGVGNLLEWLLGGIGKILSRVIDAFGGLFDVFDAIWDFAMSILTSVGSLLTKFFPFLPPAVATCINLALIAVLVAGIYKKVRNG